MSKIVVMNNVTLDGVMQSPGRPDEDTRDGFTHGGWGQLAANSGDAISRAMSERMTAGGGLAGWLFGRLTYQELLTTWNARGGPFKEALNNTPKYVVSETLTEPLAWPNSTLLQSDPLQAVRALKEQTHGVLGIMGSCQLIASLMAAGLIDEYLLMIHPLVLGEGRRLFQENTNAELRLIASESTPDGVLLVTYVPADN